MRVLWIGKFCFARIVWLLGLTCVKVSIVCVPGLSPAGLAEKMYPCGYVVCTLAISVEKKLAAVSPLQKF